VKQESIRDSYCSSQLSGHSKLFMYEVTEDGARTASVWLTPVSGAWFEQFGFLTSHHGHVAVKRRNS
jgi:hypothetical protein